MNYTYTSELIQNKCYKITAELNGQVITFNVIVAENETEIPGLVEHHLNYLKDPTPVYSEPEPLTAQQKLEAAGLTVEELKDLLGL